MPWSGWIQGDDVAGLPFRRMIATTGGGGGTAEIIDGGTDVTFSIIEDWNAAQFRAAPANNPFLPSFFDDLVWGVDYDLIPDAGFQFVEYAEPAGYVHHWTWDNGPPLIDSIVSAPGSGEIRLLTPTDYDDVDTEPSTPGLQAGAIPYPTPVPGGVTFGTFTGAEADGTPLPTPPDPGATNAFTIVAELDVPITEDEILDDRITFRIPDPVAWTRPPLFRYWIPRGAPLRLIQRGDGLGMGSGRILGTGTRQSSTRLFGAL